MSSQSHYDFVVIGAGPAGQKAAIQAAKEGRTVLLIEKDRQIGGACVHRGTIPSKTLRESVLQMTGARQHATSQNTDAIAEIQISSLLARLQSVIQAHSDYMQYQVDRNGIDSAHGEASFVNDHEIVLTSPDGARVHVTGDYFVIATGSRPRNPENILVDHENIFDSDSILSLIYVPESIVILGAGVIAAEYASILAVLGSQVTIVDKGERPLTFMEAELTARYLQSLQSFGGRFIGSSAVVKAEWDGVCRVHCMLDSGGTLDSEKVLFALGRVANVDKLALGNTTVETTARGLIDVNENFQTAAQHIYAVGDVIGPPALASTSMEQGRLAVCHALQKAHGRPANTIPVGIYTIPEMAAVGLGEAAAKEQYGAIYVGRARFEEIARGHISGIQNGLLKLVADSVDGRVLGVHIVGEGAAELIHIGQLAILKGMVVKEFVENIFNFPTLAEAYRVAALDIREQQEMASEVRPVRLSEAAS